MASLSKSHRTTIRRHVFKACEGCRQQKTKCSGESPCARCVKLSLPCVIRNIARQRRDPTTETAHNDCPDSLMMALKPVRIHNATTGRTAVYGPTSTVALLHLIARESRASPSPPAGALQGVIDSNLSIDPLNYGPLLAQQHHCSLSLQASLIPPLCITTIPNNILQLFLQKYVVTAWKLLPLQSPTQLQAIYTSSCRALSSNSGPPIMYPILLYQLALGSLCTAQGELSDMLAQESELFMSAGGYLSDELELQLNVLMAFYHSEIGSLDKAYSMLGHIASRIYAAGLHLEPRAPAVDRLLRMILSTESYLCVALGRPPLFSPNLTVPKKDEPLNTQIITGLFDITKSILTTNQEPKATFDGVCHSIWNNHARLESFWEEHQPTLLIAHTDPASPGHVEEGMFLDTIMYEYAVIANLKPFLLYLGYSHIVNRDGKDPFLVELGSSTPVRQDPRVEKALEIILASAKRIISLIFGICQRGSVSKVCVSPKDLPMHSFFIETACVSLLAYGLWCGDPGVVWESIDTGVRCLEELQYQRVAAMRLAALRATIEQSGLRRE
ncbi:hypothetical protein ASPCAL04907 [Aspergillus calidoustus]|uniref:Zn(2)-C6 fungal-type domain-containing protein n=1 Tax=Aspergillus calidoustus TaxID=454130 RepID=A0A0U5FWQ5_ASPCI|nr:hypothetical protein ASPCAL04907 [Aspergillus calidoustus]